MDLKNNNTYLETHFRYKNIHRLKMTGCKKIFHANGKQKKAVLATFISDKIYLKGKDVLRQKLIV